ncbi:MAG TPA: hypothetical protein VMU51_32200 [Mycobacteriales bacterium]|nr:hypothetical protein [Mycobacteriales bacterium]
MKSVKIGLSLLAAASALALTLAPAANAAPSSASAAPAAAAIAPALVSTTAKPPVRITPAGAQTNADQDGACNSLTNGDGDFCFWFSANFVGSLADYFTSKANLNTLTYLTPGLGLGQVVGNDSESSLNADTRLSVVVFTGVNGTGAAGLVNPRGFGNFNATFINNVESFRFM